MRAARKVTLSVLAAAAVGIGFVSWNAASAAPGPAAAVPSLSASEKADLAFTREEERMARDLYKVFADKYSAGQSSAVVFSRIATSEQRHFDAVGTQLTRYSVADPAKDAKAGVFGNADLQKLYDGWLADGLKSVQDAYKAAIALEKRDIADLSTMLEGTKVADLDTLYGHLQQASKHHLSAFTAASQGKTPTGLGPMGNRNGNGMGPGNGPGMGPRNGAGTGPRNGTGPQRQHTPGDCPNA